MHRSDGLNLSERRISTAWPPGAALLPICKSRVRRFQKAVSIRVRCYFCKRHQRARKSRSPEQSVYYQRQAPNALRDAARRRVRLKPQCNRRGDSPGPRERRREAGARGELQAGTMAPIGAKTRRPDPPRSARRADPPGASPFILP